MNTAILITEARKDATAFRENTVYTADGDPIRLGANADRLDAVADRLKQLDDALGEICRLSNPDWVEARNKRDDLLDQVHELAVAAHYQSGLPATPATSWEMQGDIEILMMGDVPVGRLCHRGKPSWILNIASLSHSWKTERTFTQARAALLLAFDNWCRKAGLK